LTREAVRVDKLWSEVIAVGRQAFLEMVKREPGMKAKDRDVYEAH